MYGTHSYSSTENLTLISDRCPDITIRRAISILRTQLLQPFYDSFMTISIRIASEDDFDTICDLVVLLKLISERSLITNTLTGSTYWIAEHEGIAVGCIGLEHGDGASLVRSAAIHPDFQGRGFGYQLANVAIEAARELGDKKLFLFSTGAGAFWQRFGFEEVSVWTLAEALPNVPQVRSGIERGWINEDRAWTRSL
jgi:N-acetylglutamate synthase-like GNAT family acetyltransferase